MPKTKCRNEETIGVALKLLLTLCSHRPEIMVMTLKELSKVQSIPYWRDSRNWAVNVKE